MRKKACFLRGERLTTAALGLKNNKIGFSYQKKIAARRLWQVFFVLHSYLVFRLLIIFSKIDMDVISVIVLTLLFFVYIPVYYANFSYAFISKRIWGKHA